MKWVLAAILGSATGALCVIAVLIFQPDLLRQFPSFGQHPPAAASSITPTVAGFTNEMPATTHCTYGGNTDFVVEAVFVDKGLVRTPVELSEEERTRQVNVDVTREDRPLFLVLAGHNPVLWRIRIAPKVRIAGVLVSGYYRQALVGLPKDTFVVMSNLLSRQCNWLYLPYDKGDEGRKTIDDTLYKLIGHRSDNLLYRRIAKESIVIGPSDKVAELPEIAEPVIPADIKINQSPRLYGQEVLNDMIDRQLLRHAKPREVIAWMRDAKNIGPQRQYTVQRMLSVNPDLDIDAVFVAKSAIEIPASIPTGRTIIVPEGVPVPTGRLDRVQIWRMNPHSCLGDNCGGME